MGANLQSSGEKIFGITNAVFLALAGFTMFYPLWHVLSLSLSSPHEARLGGLFWGPREFTLGAYKMLFTKDYIWLAYRNNIFITVIGTFLSVLLTATTAYPLTRNGMPGKNTVVVLIVITMLFSGGIIPLYLVVKAMGLINTLWAVFIPTLIAPFHVFLMMTFFRTIPIELEESAMMDGAKPIRIFFRIILPLSKPIIATIALFEAVNLWNNYFQALLYLNKKELMTLPLILKSIIDGQQFALETGIGEDIATESLIGATIVITLVPILMIYPYLQKYFAKGVMIGSIKS